MTNFWIFVYLGAFSIGAMPSHSFTSPVTTPVAGVGEAVPTFFHTNYKIFTLHGTSDDEEEGGTEWIKKAMGTDEGVSEGMSPQSESTSPEFTQNEIDDMENLIVSLSKESDDDKRRKRLAEILDKELEDASNGDEIGFDAEIPRFAKLFQLSLDNVGEEVQNAAREIALQQQQENLSNGNDMNDPSNGSDGDDTAKRVKSPEELQLWALIDIMVQSKTRVKLHMGSLGRNGQFR